MTRHNQPLPKPNSGHPYHPWQHTAREAWITKVLHLLDGPKEITFSNVFNEGERTFEAELSVTPLGCFFHPQFQAVREIFQDCPSMSISGT